MTSQQPALPVLPLEEPSAEPSDVSLDRLMPEMSDVSPNVLLSMLGRSVNSDQGPEYEACALLANIQSGRAVFVIVRRENGELGCALISNLLVDVPEDVQVYQPRIHIPVVVPSLVASDIKQAVQGLSLNGWRGVSGDKSTFPHIGGLLLLAAPGGAASLNTISVEVLESFPEFGCLVDQLRAGESIDGIPTAFTPPRANPN